jgi:L-asparaginase/beta-aspartyl-peptidase (threonine type)
LDFFKSLEPFFKIKMIYYGIIAHGGAGSPSDFSDGCKAACESAFDLLEKGKSALDAVVEAARMLEDDGRFNAGSGSALRLDGKTIEMDASVMDSEGNLGIVMAIRNVKNPILVAHAVMNTPHVALAGEGATVFAQKQRFEPFHKSSLRALERYNMVKQCIKKNKLTKESFLWKGHDVENLWNFPDVSYNEVFCDTIGAVAIDKKGFLAVANSTGGFSPMMLGRVGDSPMIGCGFYVGHVCALATTGMGEMIIKKMFARTVYDMIHEGGDIKEACKKGVAMFPLEISVGIIAISKTGYSVVSNSEMAHYAMVKEK